MMRGMYSMDRVMDTEFRGDHSGSVSIDFLLGIAGTDRLL